jgi:hypothetical protein
LRRRDRWAGNDRNVAEGVGSRRTHISLIARSPIADQPWHYPRLDQAREPRGF